MDEEEQNKKNNSCLALKKRFLKSEFNQMAVKSESRAVILL